MTENQRTILIIDDCPEEGNLSPLPARIPNTPIRFWRKSMGKWAGIVQFGKARCHFAGLLLQILMGWSFWTS